MQNNRFLLIIIQNVNRIIVIHKYMKYIIALFSFETHLIRIIVILYKT
jgi:hypothetical protein